MKVAVIGIGHIGSALTRLWAARGHEVVLGVHTQDRIAGAVMQHPGATAALVRDAALQAGVIVLAVPWTAVASVLEQAGNLAGKVLIDTTNPVAPDLSGLAVSATTSAAEVIQQSQPAARVVKAFNTLGAGLLGNANIGGMLADGFYCGDDADAKSRVATLVGDAQLHPLDAGSLRNARYLEAMAMLWIDMAIHQGRSGRFGFKLLTEPSS